MLSKEKVEDVTICAFVDCRSFGQAAIFKYIWRGSHMVAWVRRDAGKTNGSFAGDGGFPYVRGKLMSIVFEVASMLVSCFKYVLT